MIEKLKKHWLISVLIVCSTVAGATWKVAYELLVAPREYQISLLKDENSKLKEENQKLRMSITAIPAPATDKANTVILNETAVFENASVTTDDGRCNIHVVRVSGDLITMDVGIGSTAPVTFENKHVGSRITVEAKDKFYYIDLHRVRGNIVDLSVHRSDK